MISSPHFHFSLKKRSGKASSYLLLAELQWFWPNQRPMEELLEAMGGEMRQIALFPNSVNGWFSGTNHLAGGGGQVKTRRHTYRKHGNRGSFRVVVVFSVLCAIGRPSPTSKLGHGTLWVATRSLRNS